MRYHVLHIKTDFPEEWRKAVFDQMLCNIGVDTIDGDDYTVLKYIRQSPRTGCIRLESFNSRFDPQDIPSSSITALALVKASITFHTIG